MASWSIARNLNISKFDPALAVLWIDTSNNWQLMDVAKTPGLAPCHTAETTKVAADEICLLPLVRFIIGLYIHSFSQKWTPIFQYANKSCTLLVNSTRKKSKLRKSSQVSVCWLYPRPNRSRAISWSDQTLYSKDRVRMMENLAYNSRNCEWHPRIAFLKYIGRREEWNCNKDTIGNGQGKNDD